MEKHKRKSELLYVYKPEKSQSSFGMALALFFSPIVLCLVFLTIYAPTHFIFTSLFIAFFVSFLIGWYLDINTSIYIYEDGLELQRGFSYYFIAWGEMDFFELRDKGFGPSRHTLVGIRLRNHVESRMDCRWGHWFPNQSLDFVRLNWGFIRIPAYLSIRIWNLDTKIDEETLIKTSIGQYLSQYAPQLFSIGEKSKKSYTDVVPKTIHTRE